MADKARIYTSVTGTDSTETISASTITFPYIKKSHVEVRISNAGETLSAFKTRLAAGSVSASTINSHYTVADNGDLTFTSATLADGSDYQVELKRNSNIDARYVDFVDGSVVTESNLDDAQKQQIYLTQELSDSKATLKEDGSIAANITGDITGDVTGNLTGNVTGNADTVTTNANLTGDVTSVGNATSIAAGVIVDADVKSDAAIAYSKLGAIPTWNQDTTGNAATVTTNANLTGDVTSTGNATSYSGTVPITKGGTGATAAQAAIDSLTQSSGATTDHVLTKNSSGNAVWSAAPGAAGGEANTASNVGTGEGEVFKQKSDEDLQFKKLAQGSNITITDSGNEITIAATGGGTGTVTGVTGTSPIVSDGSSTTPAISITDASTSAKGAASFSSDNFAVSSGAVSIKSAGVDLTDEVTGSLPDGNIASAATWNAKAAGDHNHSGVYEPADADISKTDVATEWTATQNFNSTTLTYDATQDWDLAANQVCQLTLTGNTTFDAPANINDGGFYSITIIQDGTGSRTAAWNAVFKWAGGTAPTLTTTASAKDIFVFRGDGTNLLEVGRQLNVS